jgi:LysM repeat protein
MEIYIKIHIVQKGETLESIASKYDISDVKLLRYFDNQNASKDENHHFLDKIL